VVIPHHTNRSLWSCFVDLAHFWTRVYNTCRVEEATAARSSYPLLSRRNTLLCLPSVFRSPHRGSSAGFGRIRRDTHELDFSMALDTRRTLGYIGRRERRPRQQRDIRIPSFRGETHRGRLRPLRELPPMPPCLCIRLIDTHSHIGFHRATFS
jgi:hypothetical protein